MADRRLEREQRMYDALKAISKGFMSPAQLQKQSLKKYGLEYEECLEYSYMNIQQLAADAIRGMRRPTANSTSKELNHER